MKTNNFKLLKIVVGVAISLAALISCNSASSTYTANTSYPGNLTMSADNMMALDGSEWVDISLEGSWNITSLTNMQISSSSSSVVTILQNTCSQLSTAVSTCRLFIQGTSIGSSTIILSADGYESVSESITVERNWGVTGGVQDYNFGQLSVSRNNIYAQTAYSSPSPFIYVSESGQPWQILGNSQAYESGLDNFGIASDESYVCASAKGVVDHTAKYIVSCIKNGRLWHELPQLDIALLEGISIYQGNVYVEVFDEEGINVKYCSVENCTEWQQLGQAFPNPDIQNIHALGVFESTALIESENNGVYFLDTDGSWKLYGTYIPGTSTDIQALYTESGVFVMPLNESFVEPYNQNIQYNSLSNIGGDFSSISNGIHINNSGCIGNPPFVYVDNIIYTSAEDENIYASINVDGIWSDWTRIGNNTVPICSIYTNTDGTKLYSLHTGDKGHGQVYVYSLQQ